MNKLLGIMLGITVVFGSIAATYYLIQSPDSAEETSVSTKVNNTNTISKITSSAADTIERSIDTFFANSSLNRDPKRKAETQTQNTEAVEAPTLINTDHLKGVIGSKYAFLVNPQEESGVMVNLETGETKLEKNIEMATMTPNGILIVKERTLYYYGADYPKPQYLEGSGLSMTETYFGDLNDKAKIELDGSKVTAYVFDFFDIQVKTSIYEPDRPKKVLRILSFTLD